MEEKKNEVITFRTTEKTKKILQEEAKKVGWTTGKLAEKNNIRLDIKNK